MKTTVRATRSYMAGFGTSGSLVAGAALLFLLSSAIVAFRGWPQIATGPATTSVAAAAQPTAPSRAGRRLTALLRRRSGLLRGIAAGAGGTRRLATTRGGATVSPGSSGSTSRGGTPAATASALGASGSSFGSGDCGGSCTSPQMLVTHLTSTVSQQVTSIGSEVGTQVGSKSGTVAGAVSGVSPQAGNAVQNTGTAAGNAVSGTATTGGNTVTQAGNALGGGH